MDDDFMGKVDTNKKLELVKAIRMQNQYNRQLFRSREGFLYSNPAEGLHSELHMLENAQSIPEEGTNTSGSSFRFRFMIAMVLLLCFVLCDINHLSYGGETTDTLFERMTSSPDITELFDMIK